MSQPVWVLSVDLQAKTATFQTGMAEAARAARKSFGDIRDSADEAMGGVARGTTNVRASLGLLDNSIRGNHAAAMADLVREFSQTQFVMNALPFAATLGAVMLFAGGIVELAKTIKEAREEEQKLADSSTVFETSLTKTFNSLDKRILEAGIKSDELNHDHLAALQKQLQLIDRESLDDLIHSFEAVEKAADAAFGDIKSHWYEMGIGSEGAKHALDQFKVQYESLLAQGKNKQAADLLAGTLGSAQHVLDMMHQAKDAWTTMGGSGGIQNDATLQYERAHAELKKAGVGFSEKEVNAQEKLVAALQAQESVQERIATLKELQKRNASTSTNEAMDTEADRARQLQLQMEKREQEISEKQWEESHKRAVEQLQASEQQKIAATDRGSAERLAAVEAAIKEEERYGLQDTNFYRSLQTQKLEIARQVTDEERKQKLAAAMVDADNTEKMGQLRLNAAREQQALMDAARHMAEAQRIQEEIANANQEYSLHLTANAMKIAALQQYGKDAAKEIQALQDRQTQLIQQHESEITAIQDRAQMRRNAALTAGMQQMEAETARALVNTLMRHQSFAAMLAGIGNQIVSGMMETALKSIMADDMTKERDAAAAARRMFLAGTHFPFPANIVMAPALGAMAFASVMAFEKGGIVPGVEIGDVVPAMLTPGEGVIPKGVMDNLKSASAGGGGHSSPVHLHYRPTYHVSTIDGDGIRGVLEKHSEEFSSHVQGTLRKMNRG